MATKKVTPKAKSSVKNQELQGLYQNVLRSQARVNSLLQYLSPGLDIDYECRYPAEVESSQCRKLFNRNGVARRVVNLWPDECWVGLPDVYETEDTKDETEFETTWDLLRQKKHVLHFLKRMDVLSGIGSYGVMLLGIDDGGKLDTPVESVESVDGVMPDDFKGAGTKHRLLFLKCFDESAVTIEKREPSTSSPRYGLPLFYKVTMEDVTTGGTQGISKDIRIHWTRVLHYADNRLTSELFGESRLQAVYNNLLDLRKISSSSGEMFWRAGISGTAWGVDPDLVPAGTMLTADQKTDMKEALSDYYEGMQRYLFSSGMKPQDIAPKLTDPEPYIKAQILLICIGIAVPYRVFMGTEEGKLAGGQDRKTWLERVAGRQESYVTPLIIRPFVERLQLLGILPMTKEPCIVTWPERDTPTPKEKAETAKDQTEAMAKYVGGGVDALMAEKDFLMTVLGLNEEEAESIGDNVVVREDDEDEDLEVPESSKSKTQPNEER